MNRLYKLTTKLLPCLLVLLLVSPAWASNLAAVQARHGQAAKLRESARQILSNPTKWDRNAQERMDFIEAVTKLGLQDDPCIKSFKQGAGELYQSANVWTRLSETEKKQYADLTGAWSIKVTGHPVPGTAREVANAQQQLISKIQSMMGPKMTPDDAKSFRLSFEKAVKGYECVAGIAEPILQERPR
jgi:hypothetical protein